MDLLTGIYLIVGMISLLCFLQTAGAVHPNTEEL